MAKDIITIKPDANGEAVITLFGTQYTIKVDTGKPAKVVKDKE